MYSVPHPQWCILLSVHTFSPLLLIHTDYVFISADDNLKECCFWCVLKDFGEYQESYYSVQTTEGEQISQLIAGYIDIILKKASATEKHPWVNASFIQICVQAPDNICCDVSLTSCRSRVRIVLALRGMKNPPCWKNQFLLRSKSCFCPVCCQNKKCWPRSFRSTVWWLFKLLKS